MPCYSRIDENGQRLFLRGRLGPQCSHPRCRWIGEFLCDFPVEGGGTCSAPMCADHAHQVGPDQHCCRLHKEKWLALPKQLKLV